MLTIGHADAGDAYGTRQVPVACQLDAALTLPSSSLPSQTLFADLHPSMSAQSQIDRIVSLMTVHDRNDVWQGLGVRWSDSDSVHTSIWSRLYIGVCGGAHGADWQGAPRVRVTSA